MGLLLQLMQLQEPEKESESIREMERIKQKYQNS